MLHIFKFVLSKYISDEDRKTLLQGYYLANFDLPFNLLNININWHNDYGNLLVVKFLVNKAG
jgi:hypothetical protein